MRVTIPRVSLSLIGAGALAALIALPMLLRIPAALQAQATSQAELPPASTPPLMIGRGPDGTYQDPSIPPEVLQRAFSPPPASLPPAARPRPSNIEPPRRALDQMRRGGAVAY